MVCLMALPLTLALECIALPINICWALAGAAKRHKQ